MTLFPPTDSNTLLSAATHSARVEFRAISKSYGTHRVLHDLDLNIEPGEFVSLLGPSGCGKTTALRVLSGLEDATSGQVLLGERDVTAVPTNRRDIGMVFQSYSLFPHLTVVENTAFGLRRRGLGKREALTRAHDALDLVGLDGFASRYPHQLSGGQQQRVALARALVTEPRVLLLDEPLSALDAKVRVQLRDEIRRLQLRLGTTTVFVTHDQEEALAVSDRIAVMNGGRIEQIGTPEQLYERPASPFVAAFVGLSSVVPGEAQGDTVRIWGDVVALTTPMSGNVEVGLRPENVRLVSPVGAAENATVQESTFLGSFRRTVVLTASGHRVAVQHDAAIKPQFGDQVGLALTPVAVTARPRTDSSSAGAAAATPA